MIYLSIIYLLTLFLPSPFSFPFSSLKVVFDIRIGWALEALFPTVFFGGVYGDFFFFFLFFNVIIY